MKVLLLVIHQEESRYAEMQRVLSAHYRRYSTLDTFFVSFSASIPGNSLIEGDRLYIKGSESLVPGVLQKTIEAMILAGGERYDFVVRSNVSTIINFAQLFRILDRAMQRDIHILTGYRQALTWHDPSGGITDDKYHGTVFASGTLVAFSRHAISQLLRYRHFLDYGVVDDVALGVFFARVVKIPIAQFDPKYFIFNRKDLNFEEKKDWLSVVQREVNPVAWRNKSSSREEDAKCMEWIAQILA